MGHNDAVLAALPGTTREVAARTGLGIRTVQRTIRVLLATGRIDPKTRWLGRLTYTRVYCKRAP